METKNLKVSFYKAGGGISTRVNLPKKWINDMGLTSENNNILVFYDEEKKTICIQKRD